MRCLEVRRSFSVRAVARSQGRRKELLLLTGKEIVSVRVLAQRESSCIVDATRPNGTALRR